MNTRRKRLVVVGMLGVALCAWRLPHALAAGEHAQPKGAEKAPDTVAAIWAEVKEHEGALGKTVADKQLEKVHEAAFEIRDLVNALAEKTKGLAPDKLEKVKTNAKFVAQLAERLDKSGDSNDLAATQANFKKLQGILKTIEEQYPPESLKAAP